MARGPKTDLILERQIQTADSMGGFTVVWSALKIVTGVFSQLSANEIERWSTTIGAVSHKFMFDNLTNISIAITDRFRQDVKLYEIKSVDVITQHGAFTVVVLSEII